MTTRLRQLTPRTHPFLHLRALLVVLPLEAPWRRAPSRLAGSLCSSPSHLAGAARRLDSYNAGVLVLRRLCSKTRCRFQQFSPPVAAFISCLPIHRSHRRRVPVIGTRPLLQLACSTMVADCSGLLVALWLLVVAEPFTGGSKNCSAVLAGHTSPSPVAAYTSIGSSFPSTGGSNHIAVVAGQNFIVTGCSTYVRRW